MDRLSSILKSKIMRKEKEMDLNFIAPSKFVKLVSATLFCLMLASSIVGSGINVVPQAQGLPWSIELYATRTLNPYWGYYGGYFDLWARIAPELAKIGITLKTQEFSDFDWYDRVWDTGWNKTHTAGGWDMIMIEWWLQPHAVIPWFESMVYGNMTIPEGGFNICHWNNTKADKLLREGMQAIDAETKKEKIWRWQERFMLDPPWACVYIPKTYEITGSYVEGYNPSGSWWYDITHLQLNGSVFDAYVTNPDRIAAGKDVFIYAVSEDVWSLLPMYIETYTEEQMGCLLWSTLYMWGIEPSEWPKYMHGEDPSTIDPTDWECTPSLAVQDPIMLDGGKKARVVIRDDVYWSDGVKLTARDVQFTFNTCTLNLAAKNSGYGDFVSQIKDVEYVNETCVDFILKYAIPMSDLKSVLSNDWGGGRIMPLHKLGKYMDHPGGMRTDPSNYDFGTPSSWLPVTGPYKMVECVPGDHMTFVRNPDYFGYDLGWGPHVNNFIIKWVPDPATRLIALEKNEIDFGEYPTGPVSKFKELMVGHPNIRVSQYLYPATNAIWFNLDHPDLSNRYLRLAIAHAIPCQEIFDDILPGWGIEVAYRGLTHILPCHYYTEPPEYGGQTVSLFNTELAPYEYDINKAMKYMELWWYSKTGKDCTKGPLGDADFSGFVEMPDYYLWVKWFGKTTGQITFLPGQDVDPDFDNSGLVAMLDYYNWTNRIGWHYP